MLKASLQLRLGQQLTMTPQLQQAIRLLQLPSLELQAHIRELLETNVMLEADEDSEVTAEFEALGADPNEREPTGPGGESDAPADEPAATVEVIDDPWIEATAAPGETPWNSDDEERQQEFHDERGESLHEHLLWQLELAPLGERERAIGRAIIDAVNDDGYITDSLATIAATLQPEIDATEAEITAMLAVVQTFDPLGVAARNVAECVTLQLRAVTDAGAGADRPAGSI
jgi:RNA polymerase sigma-54 factor